MSPELEHEHHQYRIEIDRKQYEVTEHKLTGERLRHLPHPPIGPDRDLFEIVPGHPDRKIRDHEEVTMRNGERFFTAPAHINPGRSNQ